MTSRPIEMTDPLGVPMLATSEASPGLVDALLVAHVGMTGDADEKLASARAADPHCLLIDLIEAIGLLSAMETRTLGQVGELLDRVGASDLPFRERGHLDAARAWLVGDLETSGRIWETLLHAHPRDLLAAHSAHMVDFYLGNAVEMRDRMARILPEWPTSHPAYGYLLGIYAFGLEEAGQLELAGPMVQRALDRHCDDIYAIHAGAHVFEMKGDFTGGIAWLEGRGSDWCDNPCMGMHVWWHKALYYFNLTDISNSLAVFDRRIAVCADGALDDLDGAALLWRLHLLDVDVKDRSAAVAERWAHVAEQRDYPFNAFHAVMAFGAAGRTDLVGKLCQRRGEPWRIKGIGGTAMAVADDLIDGFAAFTQGRFEVCVDRLDPIRYRTHAIGGSHAQRDVIHLTLIEAAIRAHQTGRARALLHERRAARGPCPLQDLLEDRLERSRTRTLAA
ncbi:MAG: tetratricopeptide repeat protein [Geminicoccaceae bacterium]